MGNKFLIEKDGLEPINSTLSQSGWHGGSMLNGGNDFANKRLDDFRIEIPSWGFANTGTRFGKFLQAGAATTLEEKFADAAQVHELTGITPTLALHVLWDLADGEESIAELKQLVQKYGVQPGSINPNLFQHQEYKFGSICNPDAKIRAKAIDHLLESVELGKAVGSQDISMWVADGSNYPGSQSMRKRIQWLEEAMKATHDAMAKNQRMLIEYKPFEPAFYHTDIADWGMSAHLAQVTGPQAKVLVDTGHHYQGQNIEQIVAWLMHMRLLGGFHFNDRRYADDDLTLGSIDPYQIFRIFHEICVEPEEAQVQQIAFMIDQSHNLKAKVEAMVQTVMTAQELYLKAALVDRKALARYQEEGKIVEAEECLRTAFWTDVRPHLEAWRVNRGLKPNPLVALRESGYIQQISEERGARNAAAVSSYA